MWEGRRSTIGLPRCASESDQLSAGVMLLALEVIVQLRVSSAACK